MNGVNLAEAGHSVLVLPPQTISGGTSTELNFSMKTAEHVSIYVMFGAEGGSPPTVPTSIVVNQCTSAAGAGATAITNGFRYYYQLLGGAGNDILNGIQQAPTNNPNFPPNYATSAGITTFPTSVANLVFVIEIDSAELEAIADVVGPITEYPYLQVVINNGAYTTYACVLAVLTGLRYAYKESPSVTV